MEKMVEVEPATQDELRQDLKSLFQGAIRLTLEMVLEEELKAMVGARRFERVGSRKGHRNGTYLRRLLTSLGQIDVTVPRSREGGSPADVMGRYQRRSEEVDAMMVEAYVSGVSQRKMGDVTEVLMGERVGRSTVSRVAKRLDEGVQTLRSAPIEGVTSGALFFSPFFMLVVGLTPVQAVGAGLLTEVFGMGNGLRSYVKAKLVDYATARWLLLGSVPAVVLGAVDADMVSDRVLKGVFGIGLLVLSAFLILVRSRKSRRLETGQCP